MDLLPWIADERRRLADLVEGLTPEQLRVPSLCADWTVHDVAAHLLMPLVTSFPRVMLTFALSRFDFDEANRRLTAGVARRSPAELVAGLRQHAGHRFHPPGMGHDAPLADLLVHRQDIRRPLGLPVDLDPERARPGLDLAVRLRVDRAGARFHGLRFETDDLDWSAGTGPVVRGPVEAVLLVLNARPVAVADLTGEGIDEIRSRLRGRSGAAD